MKVMPEAIEEGWLSTRNKTKVKPIPALKRHISISRPKVTSARSACLTQNSPPPHQVLSATKQTSLLSYFKPTPAATEDEFEVAPYCLSDEEEDCVSDNTNLSETEGLVHLDESRHRWYDVNKSEYDIEHISSDEGDEGQVLNAQDDIIKLNSDQNKSKPAEVETSMSIKVQALKHPGQSPSDYQIEEMSNSILRSDLGFNVKKTTPTDKANFLPLESSEGKSFKSKETILCAEKAHQYVVCFDNNWNLPVSSDNSDFEVGVKHYNRGRWKKGNSAELENTKDMIKVFPSINDKSKAVVTYRTGSSKQKKENMCEKPSFQERNTQLGASKRKTNTNSFALAKSDSDSELDFGEDEEGMMPVRKLPRRNGQSDSDPELDFGEDEEGMMPVRKLPRRNGQSDSDPELDFGEDEEEEGMMPFRKLPRSCRQSREEKKKDLKESKLALKDKHTEFTLFSQIGDGGNNREVDGTAVRVQPLQQYQDAYELKQTLKSRLGDDFTLSTQTDDQHMKRKLRIGNNVKNDQHANRIKRRYNFNEDFTDFTLSSEKMDNVRKTVATRKRSLELREHVHNDTRRLKRKKPVVEADYSDFTLSSSHENVRDPSAYTYDFTLNSEFTHVKELHREARDAVARKNINSGDLLGSKFDEFTEFTLRTQREKFDRLDKLRSRLKNI